MSDKRALGRNAVWNVAGMAVEMGTGFLVMPFLIHRLGVQTYDVWTVIGAIAIYLILLDLGVRGSIGRHVALYRSAGDQPAVNRTVTGGLVVLVAIGATGVGVLLAGEGLFFRAFDVPEALRPEAAAAYRLMAGMLGTFLVGTAFDATLWGLQRFDWLNQVDIPASVARLVLTFVLIDAGYGLAALAAISFGTTAAAAAAKAVLCFRADPGLRVGPSHLTGRSVAETLEFGSWNLIGNVARVSRRQLSPMLIGSLLGFGLVAPFSVADRLLGAVAAALAAVTGVLTPYATGLHAAGQPDRQRRLLLVGGRHSAALAGCLVGFLLALGGPLIGLWIGSPAVTAAAVPLLIALAVGELLPATQYVANGTLIATGRHRLVAALGLVETAAVCGLTVALVRAHGLAGAGVAVAIPAVLFRGVVPAVLGCRAVGVPAGRYAAEAVLAPLACAVLPGLAVGLAARAYPPGGWAGLIGYSAGYGLLFAVGYGVLVGPGQVAAVARRAAGRFRRPAAAPPVG